MKHLFHQPTYHLAFLLLVFATPSQACTSFIMRKGDAYLLAKNLDWPIGTGYLMINHPGQHKAALTQSANPWGWIAKYGSVTFNQFGRDLPLCGMNEKGLVVEELNSPVWVPYECISPGLNEFQLVQYLLDRFSTVKEVIQHLPELCLETHFICLHYILLDANGDQAIIEMENDGFHMYRGSSMPYPVLSNNRYLNSVKYLKKFEGFGGTEPIINRPGSNERFVTVCDLLSKEDHLKNCSSNPFSILATISQEDTQWSIVYNATARSISFIIHPDVEVHTIELAGIKFSDQRPRQFLDLTSHYPGRITQREIATYSDSLGIDLLVKVSDLLKEHDLWSDQRKSIMDRFIKYQRL